MGTATSSSIQGPDRASLRRLGLAWFLLQVQFWLPVWVLYLRDDRGFTLSEIVAADLVFSATVLVLEVPLGVLADRIGHRRTLILGALLAAATQWAVTQVSDAYSLAAVWVLWGTAVTTLSGTETAYRYDLVASMGLEHRRTAIFGRFNAITSLALLTSHGLAGVAYEWSRDAPFLLNASCALLAAVLLVGSPAIRETRREARPARLWARLRADSTLRGLTLVLAGVFAYHWTTLLVVQPLLEQRGLDLTAIGVVYALAGATAIGGATLSSRALARLGLRRAAIAAMAVQVLAVFLASRSGAWIAVLGVCLHPFALNLVDPMLRAVLSGRVPTSVRAAALSVVSLVATLTLVVGRPLVGLVTESHGAGTALAAWGLIGLALAAVAARVLRRIPDADLRAPEGPEDRPEALQAAR